MGSGKNRLEEVLLKKVLNKDFNMIFFNLYFSDISSVFRVAVQFQVDIFRVALLSALYHFTNYISQGCYFVVRLQR
jgi:hypothetical protein